MWTYDESKQNDAEFLRRFIAFLQSAMSQRGDAPFKPQFVPSLVRLTRDISSEFPMIFDGTVSSGVYTVTSNPWGAISAMADNGKLMGIRPSECVVLEMEPNPYLEK